MLARFRVAALAQTCTAHTCFTRFRLERALGFLYSMYRGSRYLTSLMRCGSCNRGEGIRPVETRASFIEPCTDRAKKKFITFILVRNMDAPIDILHA